MNTCISNGRDLYSASDVQNASSRPYTKTTQDEAIRLNDKESKMGIHWTVNKFEGSRRSENLSKILSWVCEFDELDKLEQKRLIRSLGFEPSLVIESKRGFQVYFDALDATVQNYNLILKELNKKVGSDPNAISITRCLRAPNFWHWKDPERPFAVRIEHVSDKKYLELEMKSLLRIKPENKKLKYEPQRKAIFGTTKSEMLDSVGALEGLRRLSGTSYVNGESYEFRRNSNGNLNIWVNGKSTSCFIANDKVFSSQASPTILQWLEYYGHSKNRAWEIIEELLPEVKDGKR